MKLYTTVLALHAYNRGFLAGVRASADPESLNALPTYEEQDAWRDGAVDGEMMRASFESPHSSRRRRSDARPT